MAISPPSTRLWWREPVARHRARLDRHRLRVGAGDVLHDESTGTVPASRTSRTKPTGSARSASPTTPTPWWNSTRCGRSRDSRWSVPPAGQRRVPDLPALAVVADPGVPEGSELPPAPLVRSTGSTASRSSPPTSTCEVHPGYELVMTVQPDRAGEYSVVCNEFLRHRSPPDGRKDLRDRVTEAASQGTAEDVGVRLLSDSTSGRGPGRERRSGTGNAERGQRRRRAEHRPGTRRSRDRGGSAMAEAFRTCPTTGLKVHLPAENLIKANAVAAVVFLAVGGLFGLLVALTRWPAVHPPAGGLVLPRPSPRTDSTCCWCGSSSSRWRSCTSPPRCCSTAGWRRRASRGSGSD